MCHIDCSVYYSLCQMPVAKGYNTCLWSSSGAGWFRNSVGTLPYVTAISLVCSARSRGVSPLIAMDCPIAACCDVNCIIYKSLFTTWVANRQTDKDRQKTIQRQNTREEEKKRGKPQNAIQFTTSTQTVH